MAFSKEKALYEIEQCRKQKKLILGGDVYLRRNNKIIITGDSWYIEDRYVKQNDIEYGVNKSLEYIEKYKTRKGVPVFSLVILNN